MEPEMLAKILESTRTIRLLVLLALLIMVLLSAGCSAAQQWCDDNPRQCRVVVVGSVALACVAVAGVAVSQTRGSSPRQIGPVATTCTTGCSGGTT